MALEALTHVVEYFHSERMAQRHQVLGEHAPECQNRLTIHAVDAYVSLSVQHRLVLNALKE